MTASLFMYICFVTLKAVRSLPLVTGFIISAFSSVRIFSMVVATMSIAVEASIAKIYAAAPEIDYFCHQLSPDSFSFHNTKNIFSFPLLMTLFLGKAYNLW